MKTKTTKKTGFSDGPDGNHDSHKRIESRHVMSLEGVWYEVDCKVADSSYQIPSKLITFLTKNSPSGLLIHFNISMMLNKILV